MRVRLVRADRLYGGLPWAYASIAQPGALVVTAGACPLDENKSIVGVGDVRLQAAQAVVNLAEAVAAAGDEPVAGSATPAGGGLSYC
ncbi:MAG TPA: hypothetical protein VLW50_03755 [Streptosporangiaceae bacterium]|nr:hypothetical protein [Streptosporangiaceae bacterium]